MDQPSSTESNALTLRIKFKSTSLDDFIGRYGVDVSPGGIFIRTKQPVEVGTTLQFEFSLADGSSLLAGLGTVAWVRENDPSRSNNVPGMGLRFDKLTPDSQQAHQTILAEKARKEGKPQGTPYPPTAFVAPASRHSPGPDSAPPATAGAHEEAPAKPESSPANFSTTLPAPAALVARAVEQSISDADEFESGGKTEISDKPLEYYMQEAEAAAKAAPAPTEDSAPDSPFEDVKTDAHPVAALDAPPAPEEVSITDSQAYATEAPAPPEAVTDSGERGRSGNRAFASLIELGDTAETQAAGLDPAAPSSAASADSSSGVPILEATPEKTEEVSLMPNRTSDEMSGPVDLGSASPSQEVEEVPPLSEAEKGRSAPKRSRALMVFLVLLSGAAAFAAVYLIQTKPWEGSSLLGGPTVVVKKGPAVAVVPIRPPAPPVKPAPAAVPAAAPSPDQAKPAAEEATTKQAKTEDKGAAVAAAAAKAAAEKAAAEKAAAEKAAAEKAAAEKAAAEKAATEKAAAEKAAAEKLAHAKKPSARSHKPVAVKEEPEVSTATRVPKPAPNTGAEPTSAVKPTAEPEEEIYRISFRSSPTGAEVLIDGEYFMRTPCVKRVLDPKKSMAITIRHLGYEPHERMIGSSASWTKKGNERVLSISVNLKKLAKPAESEGVAKPTEVEAKPVPKSAPDFAEPVKE